MGIRGGGIEEVEEARLVREREGVGVFGDVRGMSGADDNADDRAANSRIVTFDNDSKRDVG